MMKNLALLFVPLALVAAAFAQQADADKPKADTVDGLVKQLGHDNYDVREIATKKLIAMGEKAIPALEQALKSEDLEVRLRAGRALRAIRAKGKPEAQDKPADNSRPEERPKADGPEGRLVATQLSMANGKVTLKVTRIDKDGKRVTKTYEGTSIEELKKKHPELKDIVGNFRVTTRQAPFRGFDMDRFWKEWGKEFNDDFWRNWQRDMDRQRERLRKLTEQMRRQRGWNEWPRRLDSGEARGKLGAAVARPSPVLDAQLELRGRGVVIDSVLQGSVANQLGLQPYDVLLEINGVPLRRYQDIAKALEKHKDGDVVTAKVIRRAKELTLTTKR